MGDILLSQGHKVLAAQVHRFAEKLTPPRTDKEYLATHLLDHARLRRIGQGAAVQLKNPTSLTARPQGQSQFGSWASLEALYLWRNEFAASSKFFFCLTLIYWRYIGTKLIVVRTIPISRSDRDVEAPRYLEVVRLPGNQGMGYINWRPTGIPGPLNMEKVVAAPNVNPSVRTFRWFVDFDAANQYVWRA